MRSPPEKGCAYCLVVCSRPDPLQLSESQWSHYIWEVCSANWWDAQKNCNAYSQHWATDRAQFFSMTMLDHILCNQCFKSWASWAMKFCLICHILLISHQSTNTTSKYLDNFLHGKCFHNQQDSENHFQEGVKSQSMGFYITEINKLISCWQKYVDYNGSYFDQ